ncbi:uncharacterized protein PpBr36_10467 [Pyricularia pennisetigena]|uniref:uncharacterized protein n=1 Tax=Pyricularia pennisetigena TaxID=1578925 RepID=UPI001154CF8F|nr:uncharacterized protein PpBr36_10467 [Pyricularia pennisetigena]TLS21063.1 hypothetical protein PpBr36_10467 [Pyricularia pennisetigena]
MLFLAVRIEIEALPRLLLDLGADPSMSIKTQYLLGPVGLAVERGTVHFIKPIIKRNQDVTPQTRVEELAWLALLPERDGPARIPEDNQSASQARGGAKRGRHDCYGRALKWAIVSAKWQVLQQLLRHARIDVNDNGSYLVPNLIMAIYTISPTSQKVVQGLLDRGADVNAGRPADWYVANLMVACESAEPDNRRHCQDPEA